MHSATGLHVLHDSGAPSQRTADYTTLVCVHGYGYHSGSFARFPMLKHNMRLILVNRRDYPGAKPYSDEASRLLSPRTTDPDSLRPSMSRFMKDRAIEFMELLAELIREGGMPPTEPRTNTGGLVLVGWSMGGLWMAAFLAHISSSLYSQALRQYVRRVACMTPPAQPSGIPAPRTSSTRSCSPCKEIGSSSRRTPLPHPPPMSSTLSPAEKDRQSARAPITRGGSDQVLGFDGYRCGVFREIRQDALYLSPSLPSELGRAGDEWEDVEVRHVWCDMSFWETPHAALMIQAELADSRARGRRVRDVVSVRLRGVNHFAHWAHPERTLRAFLADEARAMETSTPAARL